MTKGKPWTHDENKEILKLVQEGKPIAVIAEKMGRSREAVLQKIYRRGLKVVVDEQKKGISTTSSEIIMPKDLPSVEEALIILIKALNALQQPGLAAHEVTRLRGIINGVSIYKELLADYIDYRGIEADLIELNDKYEKLVEQGKLWSAPRKTLSSPAELSEEKDSTTEEEYER